ncbi:hypothetical protein [Microbacterium sp. Mcb102]|uniref:hypothetical protein n=1 Tax=Microbacterium sp. Mcb102 TaxID=2926012 RepID=UPI0021C824EE|nr:hypothetical protein [Microbacterium sp. Mcb102]
MTEAVFWSAVQGIGTVIAAVAAIIALIIAGSQLRQLIASNRLLAESNDAMVESNIAVTRPYVIVDYQFRPSVSRRGGTTGSSVFVVIRNDGRTPAHNITMKVDRPFTPVSKPDGEGWRKSLEDLNRMMNGESVIRSLTAARPLKYYIDDEALFGVSDEAAPRWSVQVSYEDAEGRAFRETFHLDVEPWRRSIAEADPLIQAGKYIESVAYEVRDVKQAIRSKQSTFTVEPRIFTDRGNGQRHRRRVERLRGKGQRA